MRWLLGVLPNWRRRRRGDTGRSRWMLTNSVIAADPFAESEQRGVQRKPRLARPCDGYVSTSNDAGDAWNLIDTRLSEWMADPSATVDYNADPPSRMTIRIARDFIREIRQKCWPAPDTVV